MKKPKPLPRMLYCREMASAKPQSLHLLHMDPVQITGALSITKKALEELNQRNAFIVSAKQHKEGKKNYFCRA